MLSRLAGFSSPLSFNPTNDTLNGFITVWDTTQAGSANDTIVLPLYSTGTYNFDIDWGDGNNDTITVWNQAETTHVYAASGTYTVTITGTIIGWRFHNGGDKAKLLEISNWGPFTSNVSGAFYGCSNMDLTATDAPAFAATDQSNFFRGCSTITTPDVSAFDFTGVTSIPYFWMQCTNFNGDLSNWDISGISSIYGMFWSAISFNNDSLAGWDISGCNSLTQLFYSAGSFNGDVSSWNTSGIVNMNSAFFGTSYNGDLSGWDFSNVTSANSMFRSCAFNNNSINGWNTSSLQNAASMFQQNTLFDQDISAWDMSSCTNMSGMLRQTAFNQDIGGWTVSNVLNMSYLFFGANSFNQDIGGWDVSSVTNMTWLFSSAISFDQDISAWDINQVSAFSLFMHNTTISTPNYDALLISWEPQVPTYSGAISFGTAQYTLGGAAEASRDILVGTYSWTITDGGGI